MAYTVRTDETTEKVIETLKTHYDESAATKALLRAAEDVPQMAAKIASLETKLSAALDRIEAYAKNGSTLLDCLKTLEDMTKPDLKKAEERAERLRFGQREMF